MSIMRHATTATFRQRFRAYDGSVRRTRFIVLFACVALALALAGRAVGCGGGLRVGTFNIEQFGGRSQTDMDRLAAIVRGLEADVLAVQEIQDDAKVKDLARRASTGGRRYEVALSRCGGKSQMKVGFLYDAERVALRRTREYPELDPGGGGSCGAGERAGLLGVFAPRGDDGDEHLLHLLVVHLRKGGEADDVARRQKQWERAYEIVAALRAGGAKSIAILGDTNSTGYLDDEHGERRSLDESARRAGMDVVSDDLDCSEYWPKTEATLSPSLLDHVVVTKGLSARRTVRLHGYCAEARCAPLDAKNPPRDYASVSDHCPVTAWLSP
jgi:endonuclease/exonuclease/phosphatase family metal-dependent hydrolase